MVRISRVKGRVLKKVSEPLENARERIWQVVNQIPEGRVATYGQVAHLAGMPSHARLVGRTLGELPRGSKLPWHRVINAQGKISNPNAARQQARLEAEGITLMNGRVSLRTYGWKP